MVRSPGFLRCQSIFEDRGEEIELYGDQPTGESGAVKSMRSVRPQHICEISNPLDACAGDELRSSSIRCAIVLRQPHMSQHMQCPACGYARKSSDQNPVNQCPSCKQIYSRIRKEEPQGVAEQSQQPSKAKGPWRPFGTHPGVIFLMMWIVFAAAWGYGSSRYEPVAAPTPIVHDGVSAQLACQRFVSSRLKAPSTASFAPFEELSISESGDSKFVVSGWVDSQNSFGAKLRTPYLCSVQFVGTRVELLNLQIVEK